MSFVRTALPELRISGPKSPLDTQDEAPFLEEMALVHDEMTRSINRRQVIARRWLDMAGACAITLCICAWVAIKVAAVG